jgi:adenosylcobinamide-GDP ribazoletransferase
MILDAWRLATGTLTALRVRPPGTVDRRTAGAAMVLAPLAVLPLAVGVFLILWLSFRIPLATPIGGVLAVALLALGTRAMHVDGLADTADGLAASYDRERSLAVMKGGTSGPAGVAAIVLALLLQAMGFAALVGNWRTATVAALAVCFSRCAFAWCCTPLLGAARPDGLGRTFVGTVPVWVAACLTVVVGALLVACASIAGLEGWRAPAAGVLGLLAMGLLLRRASSRFGGITGDVFGAAVEVTLAATLILLGSGL